MSIIQFTDAVRATLAQRIVELERKLAAEKAANAPLRDALRFYASGRHINSAPATSVEDNVLHILHDADIDAPDTSGIVWQTNVLSEGTVLSVEVGTIAIAALRGEQLDWDDDATEPISDEG